MGMGMGKSTIIYTRSDNTIIYASSDNEYARPKFRAGDRIEFTVDFGPRDEEPYARAGEAGTVVGIAPTKDPVYLVKLDSDPDAQWPRTVSGAYLAPDGSGLRGRQETRTIKNRSTGELRRM
ncbi:hypothetical protein ACX801_07880 [Arthrobacter bambusae]